jgi:hypothetical protein
MTSYKRKIEEDMCMGFHPMVMMRRMWHLQPNERRIPRRVPMVGTYKRVKGRST